MESLKKFQKAVKQIELVRELKKAGSGGLPVGTIRIWHGQKFIKQPDGHWVPLGADEGAGQAASQGGTSPVEESAQQEEASEAVATEKEGVEPMLDSVQSSESTDHLKPGGEGGEVSINMADLKAVLEQGPYSIISAGTNPNDEKDRAMPDAQVSERYKALEEDLKAIGYKYTTVDGNYDGEEKSYLVFHADQKKIEELGKKYNQDSVVHMEGGENKMSFTSGDNAGKHHRGSGFSEVPDAENYYSVVKTKEGQPIKFTMDFDFGQHHAEGSKEEEAPKEESKEEK